MATRILADLTDPHSPRRSLYLAAGAALALGLLGSLYFVCQQQVREAEVRHAMSQVQRTAIADCLEYVPRATLGSCIQRVAGTSRAAAPEGGVMSAALQAPSQGGSFAPVNFAYR